MTSSTNITIAVSARALFDFEAKNQVFREDDPSTYCALQAARLELIVWNVTVDEAMFLGEKSKAPFLAEFRPDVFFDDNARHCECLTNLRDWRRAVWHQQRIPAGLSLSEESAMNHELENILVATYPTIYRSLQPRYTGGGLFQCDDGWYRIIDELSRKLETEARMSDFVVTCVKEKLGTLRVYVRGSVPDKVRDWVAAAVCLSGSTCERCGQPATLRGHEGGRIRTLCPACAEATGYTRQ